MLACLQHRTGLGHGLPAMGYGVFEALGFTHQAFSEMPRLHDMSIWADLAGTARRRKCALREKHATSGDAKEPAERRRSRESGVFILAQLALKPLACFFKRGDARFHPVTHMTESRFVRGLDLAHRLFETGDESGDRLSAIGGKLARDEVNGLYAVRALIDRRDARVAVMLRGARLFDEAHTAMHLDSL